MRHYLPLFLLIFVFACAPVISRENGVDTSLTFNEVAQDPDHYDGKTVLWGGEIVEILPQSDGTTLIEVLRWPLGWRDEPRETVSFSGEFLVLLKEPSDPSLYRKGTRITVAGEIEGAVQGEQVKSASDPTYRYPLLVSKAIHVWKHGLYPYSGVPNYGETYEYRHHEGILHY